MSAHWIVDRIQMDATSIAHILASYSDAERARAKRAIDTYERKTRPDIAHLADFNGRAIDGSVDGVKVYLLQGPIRSLVLGVEITDDDDDFDDLTGEQILVALNVSVGAFSFHPLTSGNVTAAIPAPIGDASTVVTPKDADRTAETAERDWITVCFIIGTGGIGSRLIEKLACEALNERYATVGFEPLFVSAVRHIACDRDRRGVWIAASDLYDMVGRARRNLPAGSGKTFAAGWPISEMPMHGSAKSRLVAELLAMPIVLDAPVLSDACASDDRVGRAAEMVGDNFRAALVQHAAEVMQSLRSAPVIQVVEGNGRTAVLAGLLAHEKKDPDKVEDTILFGARGKGKGKITLGHAVAAMLVGLRCSAVAKEADSVRASSCHDRRLRHSEDARDPRSFSRALGVVGLRPCDRIVGNEPHLDLDFDCERLFEIEIALATPTTGADLARSEHRTVRIIVIAEKPDRTTDAWLCSQTKFRAKFKTADPLQAW